MIEVLGRCRARIAELCSHELADEDVSEEYSTSTYRYEDRTYKPFKAVLLVMAAYEEQLEKLTLKVTSYSAR